MRWDLPDPVLLSVRARRRYVPPWVAQEMGFFMKYGLETSLVFVRSTPILVAGLRSGQIWFGHGGGRSTLGASVGESDLKIVATFIGRLRNIIRIHRAILEPTENIAQRRADSISSGRKGG